MRCENKPLLQDDPGFLQEITSIAVEVGLAGLSQGRSRITERSPVTGFSQTSPTFMGLRSGGPFGSGCDIRAQASHRGRLVGNSSQSDKGRVARQPAAIAITSYMLPITNPFVEAG